MTTNDPIADLLTRIRNASLARRRYVDIPKSRMLLAIAHCFEKLGFVENVLVNEEANAGRGIIRVFLKYQKGRRPVIQGLKRVSSPGTRQYTGRGEIPRVFEGLGATVLTTSKGVMDGESARQAGVGGEVLCYIW